VTETVLTEYQYPPAAPPILNLAGADFGCADTSDGTFCTNLAGADLQWVNLTGANFTGANLTGADLILANLTGATIPVAPTGVTWSYTTCPDGTSSQNDYGTCFYNLSTT
jgi:hypothetical protein